MNNFTKKLIVLFSSALILFAAGCSKKPSRATPTDTMMGPGTGADAGSGNLDMNAGAFGNTYTPNANDLSIRTTGADENGMIRNVAELQPIYFDFDRSAVKQSERAKVQAVKDYLAKNPTYRILFEGHCDWRGTAEYNLALGDRRANSVKKYALSLGVSPDKIEVVSKGSMEAKERGSDAEMSHDRRAEVVVLTK